MFKLYDNYEKAFSSETIFNCQIQLEVGVPRRLNIQFKFQVPIYQVLCVCVYIYIYLYTCMCIYINTYIIYIYIDIDFTLNSLHTTLVFRAVIPEESGGQATPLSFARNTSVV